MTIQEALLYPLHPDEVYKKNARFRACKFEFDVVLVYEDSYVSIRLRIVRYGFEKNPNEVTISLSTKVLNHPVEICVIPGEIQRFSNTDKILISRLEEIKW